MPADDGYRQRIASEDVGDDSTNDSQEGSGVAIGMCRRVFPLADPPDRLCMPPPFAMIEAMIASLLYYDVRSGADAQYGASDSL